ncbi:unnamed protein product, partial [Medioppia subpectinata]
LSWFAVKRIRKRLNKEFLTSYKRAVLVTGCDTGFGNALALKLNENGYRVYATVLDTEGEGAKKLLSGQRFEGKTRVLRMDVTKEDEVRNAYEQIQKDLVSNGEQLWAVVNNAGIITLGPLDWGTVDNYKRVFEVNTFGMVRVSRTFLPLIRQSKGRIVNLVSMAGRVTIENLGIYSMTKHAAISFTDGLRRETRKWGIKVSSIEPMAYKTPMAEREYYFRELDKQWSESTDDVKQLYGQQYYEEMRRNGGQLGADASDNIYEVIDKMVDAIRSPDPQIRYVSIPGKCGTKLMVKLLQLLPIEIYDRIAAHKSSTNPKPAGLDRLRSEE